MATITLTRAESIILSAINRVTKKDVQQAQEPLTLYTTQLREKYNMGSDDVVFSGAEDSELITMETAEAAD